MSRIDEALRRARGDGGRTVDPEPVGPVAAFDQYAREAWVRDALSTPLSPPPTIAGTAVSRDGHAGEGDPELEGKLVTSPSVKPLAIQQYRRLAAALVEVQIERGFKSIMVTSAVPSEGKSFTITNLALTLGEAYRRRVILIDADLRHPTLHEIFRVPNTRGLSDGLRSHAGPISPVTVSPYLTVLPAGKADQNPLASLTSDRMKNLIEEAASSYEWVLIDTPPVSLLPDAHHLARFVDGVMVVIAAGATPYSLIERTIVELGRDKIVGIVLNRAADETIASARYHGSYY